MTKPILKRRMIGRRFGRWTVTECVHRGSKGGGLVWLCTCDCGNTKKVNHFYLIHGDSKSCGCLRKDTSTSLSTIHGYSNNPQYFVWQMMKDRCTNPNSKMYHRYGGRGITVCDSWLESFQNFLDDMGERPFEGAQLDRKDNDKGYYKDNCRWVTNEINGNNKSNTIFLTFNGETLSVTDWSKKTNLNKHIIRERLTNGWSVERILTTANRLDKNGVTL